jgi:predicted Zn-dependent protease
VVNADAHAALAHALAETNRRDRSIEEYDTAIGLKRDKPEWRLALAKVCIAAGRKTRARQVLADLLDRDAQYPGARDLLNTLGKGDRPN